MRILESGLPVYGFGERKTPQPFVDACSPFIYTENLVATEADQSSSAASAPASSAAQPRSKNELRGDTSLVRLLRTAVEKTSDEDGWAHLGKVGHYISNNSSFSVINHGYKKLGELVKATELFEIEMRGESRVMYVKDARK